MYQFQWKLHRNLLLDSDSCIIRCLDSSWSCDGIYALLSWLLVNRSIHGSVPASNKPSITDLKPVMWNDVTRPNIEKQAGKLTVFGTCPNWVVSYIAYTKFHSPRPVFHSPGQIFTCIGGVLVSQPEKYNVKSATPVEYTGNGKSHWKKVTGTYQRTQGLGVGAVD